VPKLNILRLEEDLSATHLRLQNVHIEQLPWEQVVMRYDRSHTLFYLDPPYWGTDSYGAPFELREYERMAELAATVQGAVLISINDHPEMRRIFGRFSIEEFRLQYTVAGAGGVPAQELLVSNVHCDDLRRVTGPMSLF